MALARKTLLGISLTLGAFLLFGELAARFAQPLLRKQSPPYYYRQYIHALTEPSDSLIWEGRSGITATIENSEGRDVGYALNSLGWRDREYPGEKKWNVLVLGDSFSFGTGVPAEETFSSLLERAHPDTEFWNLGVMGYAPDQYAVLVPQLLVAGHWDGIVVQLSNNDLGDVERHSWLDKKGNPAAPGSLPARVAAAPGRGRLFSSASELVNIAQYFYALGTRSAAPPAALEEALERLLLALNSVVQAAKKEKIPLVLVQASDWGENVYGKALAELYRRDVRGLLQAQGVPLIEPHAKIRDTDFLPFPDLHWRVSGHALLAIELTNAFRALRAPFAPVPKKIR